MKLNDLVNRIPHTGASDTDITAITYDSRKACAGSLFVCLVGAWLDGHTYAASAYQNGCRAFLVEHTLDLPADAVQIVTDDTRAALAVIGADFYGNPADKLHLIGITDKGQDHDRASDRRDHDRGRSSLRLHWLKRGGYCRLPRGHRQHHPRKP